MKIENRNLLEKEIARRSLSYKQTALIAGISERTLKQARNGEEIRTATAGRIAAALGMEIEDLIK